MKTKKLSSAMILLATTMVAYLVSTLIFGYTTKPEVTKGQFPFSITYEYKGVTGILSGIFKCEFSNSETILGEHNRYWDQETIYDNPENLEYPFVIDQNDNQQITLSLYENMSAGYFMGDPLYKDYYSEYGYDGVEPSVSYYDYKNNVYLDGKNTEAVLESIDFKIVDFTYAKPIENSFSFSGIRYEADNMIIFAAIMLVFFILCLIFVRKDKEYRYSKLEKFGIVLNFVMGIFVLPIIFWVCLFFSIVESGVEAIDQTIYNIPPISLLCLALSVVFRRKGYPKTSFFIQFGGVLPIAIIFVLEIIFKFH